MLLLLLLLQQNRFSAVSDWQLFETLRSSLKLPFNNVASRVSFSVYDEAYY